MSTLPSLLPLGILALSTLLGTLSSEAGFTARRLGITHVPIGGESSDKDILEIADNQGVSYPPINVPVPAADIMKLQGHPLFAGKTPQQIQDKVVNIRRSVLCAIDLLRRTDPETAEGLQTNFRAGMICIGLAPRNYNVGAAIRNDGKEEFQLEPINIYQLPCNRLPLWSPDLFDLANTLAHEGLHGRQNVLGWRDATPLEVAKDRQCKEIEASQGELDRANKMCSVINEISSSGKLPDDARGMYARIGADFLRAFPNNNAARRTEITKWRQKLRGIKLRAQEVKTFREAYKNAADLAINGSPNAAQILADLRKSRLFQYYGGTNEFAPITRWYLNNAPRFVPAQGGNPPRVEGGNEMKQLIPPAEEFETFTVDELDTITTGFIWEDRNLGFIGGIDFADNPGEEDEGVVVGYDLDPTTKAILPNTSRVCLRSTQMAGGYVMNYNSFDQRMYALQLDTNVLCELRDNDNDGCPDEGIAVGFLPAATSGELRLDFSYFHFSDRDTIVATHELPGTMALTNDPLCISWREPDGDFISQPFEEFNDQVEIRPGFDGCLSIGSNYAPLIGTPWGRYQLYDDQMMVGEGCFSAHGRACHRLENPLGTNSRLRLVDALNACESVPTLAKAAPPNTPKLEFSEDTDFDLGVGIRYKLNPDLSIRLNYSDTLEDFDQNEFDVRPANRFGISWGSFDTGGLDRGFFRGVTADYGSTEIDPQPDSFVATPGLKDYFDVSKNDNAPPSAKYHLVTPPVFDGFVEATEDAFKFYGDGTFDLAFPSFDSQLQFSYRLTIGSYVSEDITATVLPNMDTDRLRNPPTKGNFGDITFLEILVLTIGERDYPLYQFSLRPQDNCPTEHWHSPGRSLVFPIGLPATQGISDPDPPNCGYGTLEQLPVRRLIVSKASWDTFLADHP